MRGTWRRAAKELVAASGAGVASGEGAGAASSEARRGLRTRLGERKAARGCGREEARVKGGDLAAAVAAAIIVI